MKHLTSLFVILLLYLVYYFGKKRFKIKIVLFFLPTGV